MDPPASGLGVLAERRFPGFDDVTLIDVLVKRGDRRAGFKD
jgi:hypothetical protein